MPRSTTAICLKERLKACMRDGNLTVADLAYWLSRPDPTLRTWIKGTRMQGGPGDQQAVLRDLKALETLIAKKRGFPVPPISLRKRKAYLDGVWRK